MKVVNRRCNEPYDVYIGRPTYWGNPFKIGPDGTRAEVLAKYEDWVRNSDDPDAQWIRKFLGLLKGRTLGCWCASPGGLTADDSLRCHGQILIKLLKERDHDLRI